MALMKGYRLVVGTERENGGLVFRCRCMDCEFQQKSNTMYGIREIGKSHVQLFCGHKVLIGQAYMFKSARTRWGGGISGD